MLCTAVPTSANATTQVVVHNIRILAWMQSLALRKQAARSVCARAVDCPSINTYRADHCHAYVFHARLLEGFPQVRGQKRRLNAATTDAR
jgi:hypothetical protein